MKFWLNGEISESPIAINISDRGLLLGDGLFETFSVQNGLIQDIEGHLNRLVDGLHIFKLSLPYSLDQLGKALEQVVFENKIENGSLRLSVTRGSGPRGLLPPVDCRPTVLITGATAAILPGYFPEAKLVFSTIRRNETSPASRLKTIGGYLDNIFALSDAKDVGADDAILLNMQGHVASTTMANIFIERRGEIFTPPISDGVLNGITRKNIISQYKKNGIEIYVQSLFKEDIEKANKIWITNSLVGMREAKLLKI